MSSFNPVTSSKAKFLETRPDGFKIYKHTARGIHGAYVVSAPDGWTWQTAHSLEEAREIDTTYFR